MSVRITLTPAEMFIGEAVGTMRNAVARSQGWRSTNNGPNDLKAEANHIMGAHGELATARYTNLFWDFQVGHLGGVDVGGIIEVKTRRHRQGMALHPTSKDALPFVDVCCTDPPSSTYVLNGWCYGSDGKQQQFWLDAFNNGRPAFWVPLSVLQPMPLLRRMIAERQQKIELVP